MRTLSARILLGFAALIITFGVITALVVANMEDVEAKIQGIKNTYLPLALVSKDLANREDDLRAYLDELTREEQPKKIIRDLRRLREPRDQTLAKAFANLDSVGEADRDNRDLTETRARLVAVQDDIADTAPRFQRLIAGLPLHPEQPDNPAQVAGLAALAELKIAEFKITDRAKDLAKSLERQIYLTTERLGQREQQLRFQTMFLGGCAVFLGLLVTIWVTITLRPLRRLRDAARRIAAGDYGSRIPDQGPAEVADLAREFNSMGRAVEERERELVRSERLAAVGKMAAMITHEVRNPLSSIGLNTELLEDELGELPRADEARALCRAITREVDRLTALTEEYLAFARLPKPKVAVEACNPLVDALARFVRDDLAMRKVALVVELDPTGPRALVDASQLRQCLVNLVRNGAEAVASKGGGQVTLRTRRAGAMVEIEVADDGPGIAPEALPRLFDPFFSTKEGGSGLGLALSQQILRDHGGTLTASSAPGQGARFVVAVPAGPDATDAPEGEVASAAASGEHVQPSAPRDSQDHLA
jgi:signal transduction histidine kinase